MANGKQQGKSHFKFGLEIELFTLDKKGYVVNAADRLMKRVHELYPRVEVRKECGKNMVEMGAFPHPDVPNVIQRSMEDLESILFAAEKEELIIYPYGTYPGAFTPEFNTDKPYKIKEEIFGKQRWAIAGRCIGLHVHYTLPKGVFDKSDKTLKGIIPPKEKQELVDIYNLFIAMDPALTTFTQSSPFYQGKLMGKDARMMVYRGGDVFNYPQGLYAQYPQYGSLQPYKTTKADLTHIISERFSEWVEMVKNLGINVKTLSKHGSILDMAWNPVKINAHGTMEQRGMDMTHPRIIVAIALVIKYITRMVQEKAVRVVPSDIAIKTPFKKEGNTIYIPPETHVRLELQPKAAFKGLEDEGVHGYCAALLKLAKQNIPKTRHPLLEPLELMLKEKKTTSDQVIEEAKSMGVKIEEGISNAEAAELALRISKDIFKEITFTKHILQNL